MRRLAVAAACCLTSASAAGAQTGMPTGIAPLARPAAADSRGDFAWRVQGDAARAPTPWAVLGSLILPGAGQALLKQERFVPYLAAEAFFVMRYAQHSRDARRERDRYRVLAASVARAPFGTAVSHGTFEYYESMEHFLESGAFDAIPGGELDPEPDSTTFNGRTWLLARKTFWRDVTAPPARDSREWQLAEAFYLNRAVRPELRWSWRDAQLEYDEFKRTIRRSNDAYRDALADLGIIIANHVLSSVDALVTVRLSARSTSDRRELSIRAELPVR